MMIILINRQSKNIMVNYMKIGFIGLGKMGHPMVERLLAAKQSVVIYNKDIQKTKYLAKKGAIATHTYEEFSKKLGTSKIIWLMVPQDAVEEVLEQLKQYIHQGDIIIDGGNSNYHNSKLQYNNLKKKEISFLDAGVSGGVIAAKVGYCIMIGGDEKSYQKIEPVLKAMCQQGGYDYVGPSGSGHFVKMVHNSIEYGMMQAMGEGYELMRKGPYKNLDILAISKLWNHGSIIRSFLMEMTVQAYENHPGLKDVPALISDTGEGHWAVIEAMQYNVPFTVNSHALFARYNSRDKNSQEIKLVAALRNEFGGHGFAKRK